MMAGGEASPPPEEDELLSLLDVIHRKAVKLRAKEMVEAEMEEQRLRPQLPREDSRKFSSDKLPGLHPISENEGAVSDNEVRVTEEAKDRVRRKIIPDDGINRQDRELLVDRISELESETLQSHRKVSKLEDEIAKVNQQKEVLEDQLKTAVNIKSELDSKIHDMHSQYVKGGGGKKESGIIHSVQILTGGGQQGGDRLLDRRLLSQSETNLRRVGDGNGSINIEIRQPGGLEQSRSSEHLLYRPERQRRSSPMGHSRSVVNLQQDEPARTNSKFFQRISAPPPPGTKVSPQLHRVLSNEKLSPKSRSVENLSERARRDLAETSLQPRHHGDLDSPSSRLKGAQSEQVLSRLGRDGRARLDPALSSSVLSMPAELARGLRVRPNRERIRQVLGTSSVLELQRQLLTTVMENEVSLFLFLLFLHLFQHGKARDGRLSPGVSAPPRSARLAMLPDSFDKLPALLIPTSSSCSCHQRYGSLPGKGDRWLGAREPGGLMRLGAPGVRLGNPGRAGQLMAPLSLQGWRQMLASSSLLDNGVDPSPSGSYIVCKDLW